MFSVSTDVWKQRINLTLKENSFGGTKTVCVNMLALFTNEYSCYQVQITNNDSVSLKNESDT